MHAVPHQQGRGRAQVLQTHVTHVTASAAADRYDCPVGTAVRCSLTLLPAASSAAQAGPALAAVSGRCILCHICCRAAACHFGSL